MGVMNVSGQPTVCCSCSLQSFGTSSAGGVPFDSAPAGVGVRWRQLLATEGTPQRRGGGAEVGLIPSGPLRF